MSKIDLKNYGMSHFPSKRRVELGEKKGERKEGVRDGENKPILVL